jgi:hypothetical protein
MTPRERRADGLRIRYAEAEGVGEETVLLLNPWPESLFAWNTIWPRLAAPGRDRPPGRDRSPGLRPI